MELFFDRLSETYTLDNGKEVIFLGPMTYTMQKLIKEYGLTDMDAREAVLEAFFNPGYAINLDNISWIDNSNE